MRQSDQQSPGFLISSLANARVLTGIGLLLASSLLTGCGGRKVMDEARARQLANPETAEEEIASYAEQTYPPEDQDLFEEMDQQVRLGTPIGLKLEPEEIVGRNAWMIWTGGNEAFWDWIARNGYGTVDLLKTIDSNNRGGQWATAGLITEPGMRKPTPKETEAAYGIRFARPIKADYSQYDVNYQSQPGGYQFPSTTQRLNYTLMSPYGATSTDYDAPYEASKMPETNEVGETVGPYGSLAPPDPYIYGYSSGIVGLRLFPNPDFHPSQGFDADRYYDPDDSYSSDPNTIRPFRIGMACSFCHVGPHPLIPPLDPEFPEWKNLSSTIGAQYLRVREGLGGNVPKDNYFYHVLDSQMPGTIDTSLIASDGINNGNTMNAIFGLGWRARRALFNPAEQLSEESAGYAGLWDESYGQHLGDLLRSNKEIYDNLGRIGKPGGFEGNPRLVPRVLVDGSDSVGSWIALARVYLNIGLFHERWVKNHNPILGFRPQTPFKLADIEENSVYWHATKLRVDPMTSFFLKSTDPMKLRDAPNGFKLGWNMPQPPSSPPTTTTSSTPPASYTETEEPETEEPEASCEPLDSDLAELPKSADFNGDPWDSYFADGQRVFAQGCIACHSSIQPGTNPALEDKILLDELPDKAEDRLALDLTLDDLFELTRGSGELPELYQLWADEAVQHEEFWKENYLSTDRRIPLTITRTNAGRASATNARQGHIWEDFASWTYKDLAPVGPVPYFDPFSKSTKRFEPMDGGPGFYRVPTLISAWSTAPFLHNNALGDFNNDPCVAGRLECYQDAMNKLLTPSLRAQGGHDRGYADDREAAIPAQTMQDRGLVWRTNAESFFTIHGENVPSLIAGTLGLSFPFAQSILPWILPIIFLFLWLLFIFGERIIQFLAKLKSFVPFQEAIVPLKVLAGLVFLGLAGFAVYIAFTNRGYFQLLEAGGVVPYYFQIQTYIPAIALLAFGVLIMLTYLYESRFGKGLIWFAGWTCFACVLITSLITGPILAGKGSDIRIGPFPKGMPVNLVTNIDRASNTKDLLRAVRSVAEYLRNAERGDEDAIQIFERDVAPALMKVNKCPDIVLDHGHSYEFMQNFTDDEKQALIQLVKSF